METCQFPSGGAEESPDHVVKGKKLQKYENCPDSTDGSNKIHCKDTFGAIILYQIQDWERCEKGIVGSLEKLRAFKRQLSMPLPDHQEDLQNEQMRCKVSEKTHAHSINRLTLQLKLRRLEDFYFLLGIFIR